MKETEVTVQVFDSCGDAKKILTDQGFRLTRSFTIRDAYFTRHEDIGGLSYPELIGSSFLIRVVDGPSPSAQLVYKKKDYDSSGRVISEEKAEASLDDPEAAEEIFTLSGLNLYCRVVNHSYIYEKANVELALQEVEGLGLFIEYEEDGTMKDIGPAEKILRLTSVLKSLGLKLGDDFSVKKLYMMVKKAQAEQ